MKEKWIVDPAEDLPVAVIENTEDGLGICEIGKRTQENISNANLIAAAPDLLEACKEALAEMVDNMYDVDDHHPLADKLFAAINKAEGN
jgi:hypothetical protein